MADGAGSWSILHVEDDPKVCEQVREFFSTELIYGRELHFSAISDWGDAFDLVRQHKADLVILDIYRGAAAVGGERVGEQILDQIQCSGFAPVIIYSNLTEGLDEKLSPFVKIVPKTAGLDALESAIADIFATYVPQANRAIINHLDRTLRDYMWKFVAGNWTLFQPLVGKPEFVRLLVQRLGLAFAREGIAQLMEEAAPSNSEAERLADDGSIHPSEYYIKPPIRDQPVLGDIRVRKADGAMLIVLTPTCDMVPRPEKNDACRASNVLCVRAIAFEDHEDVIKWRSKPSKNAKEAENTIRKYMMNSKGEQWHFLPGVWDIPDLHLDFQALEYIPIDQVRGMSCIATLASPFAEALASRFLRFYGRLGTPDLDPEMLIDRLRAAASPPVASSPPVAPAKKT